MYDHKDFHKGHINSSSFVLDYRTKKLTDLRSGCYLIDICM